MLALVMHTAMAAPVGDQLSAIMAADHAVALSTEQAELAAAEPLPTCMWGDLKGSDRVYMEAPLNAVPNTALSAQDLKTFITFAKKANFGNLAENTNCEKVAQNAEALWGASPFSVKPSELPTCTWGELTGSSAAYKEAPVNAVPHAKLSAQDLKTFTQFVKKANFGNVAYSHNCADVAQNCKDLWGFSPFTVDAPIAKKK